MLNKKHYIWALEKYMSKTVFNFPVKLDIYFTALKGKFILQLANLGDSYFFTFLINLGKLSTLDNYTDSSTK